MASDLTSLWKWDFLELGNGLLEWEIIWKRRLPHLPGVPHPAPPVNMS